MTTKLRDPSLLVLADGTQFEGRAFGAKMLPPGESAHGFVYFFTGHRTGSRIYLTGIQQAATGKELFYFDVPLD